MSTPIIALPGQPSIMDIPTTEVSTRGTVPATVTPTGSARPVTAPGVEAVVIAVRAQLAAGFLLDLDIGGTRVEAASVHALPTGTRLQLRETAAGSYRVEELSITPDSLRRERVIEALRAEMQRQVLPREAVNGLLRQAASPGLDAPLQRAIDALLRRLPTPAEVQQPAGLRAALQNSGSLLEARLLRALQQPAPGAPAAGAWGALRRLYGALTAKTSGPGFSAPLLLPTTPPALAAGPLSTAAAPTAPAIPLPNATTSALAEPSAPGVSAIPLAPSPRASAGTAGASSTATGLGPASPSRTAAGLAPMPGITVPLPTTATNGTSSSRTDMSPTPGAGVMRVPVPAQLPLPASRAAAAPVNNPLPSGATRPMPATSAPTQPGTGGAMPAAPPPSAVDTVRAPAAALAGARLATSPAQGPAAQVADPQPPAVVSQAGAQTTSALAPLPAPAASRAPAPPVSSPPPARAADAASAPASMPATPAPELPAAVLASDLKAQWQLLRAALTSALARAPAAPRENTGTTTTAPSPEAAPSAAPALYTARGVLVSGAGVAAHAGVPRVPGEAAPATEPGTVERLLSQVEGVLARTRVHQFAAMPESRPATDAPQAQAWIAEIPLLHPRGVDVLQLRIENQRGHGEEGAGERHWQVMLSLDGDTLGTLHALVQLAGSRLQATLWAEREATLQAARAALGELDSALRAQGVEVARLDCVPGRPPHQAMPVRERLLDVRT